MTSLAISTPPPHALATTNPRETSFMRYFATTRGGPSVRRDALPWVPLAAIGPQLAAAAVKAEDPHFFAHRGIDWRATVAKTLLALRGQYVGGASSITQQLARNLYLTPARFVTRKLREMWLAHGIERRVSKARILELYLNVIEFGPSVWGCAAASRYYFGKAPSDLDLFESTFLIVILPAPGAGPTGVHAARCLRAQCLLACQLFVSGLARAEECAICCERVRRLHRLLADGAELRTALASSRLHAGADATFLREIAARLAIVPIPPSDALASRFGDDQERLVRERLCKEFGADAIGRIVEAGSLDALKERRAS